MLQKICTVFFLLVFCSFGFTLGMDERESWGALPSSLFFCKAEAAIELDYSSLYSGESSRGIEFSDKLKNAEGEVVAISGFMAPPLTPTINFFVLTSEPMSICPFCSSDADWPDNIIVVQLSEPVTSLPFDAPIRVEGVLSLGSQVDSETGFVSLVRIRASSISRE